MTLDNIDGTKKPPLERAPTQPSSAQSPHKIIAYAATGDAV
ncbi:MAG: hypothetical protein ACK40X_03160 [Armatimonadota bacterium]